MNFTDSPLTAAQRAAFAVFVVVVAVAVVGELAAGRRGTEPRVPWTTPMGEFDGALRRGDIAGARDALRQAAAATLRLRTWDSLVAVGDAQLRLALAAGYPGLGVAAARENYRAALLLARAQRSVEGIRRATTASTAVDDLARAPVRTGIARHVTDDRDPWRAE